MNVQEFCVTYPTTFGCDDRCENPSSLSHTHTAPDKPLLLPTTQEMAARMASNNENDDDEQGSSELGVALTVRFPCGKFGCAVCERRCENGRWASNPVDETACVLTTPTAPSAPASNPPNGTAPTPTSEGGSSSSGGDGRGASCEEGESRHYVCADGCNTCFR